MLFAWFAAEDDRRARIEDYLDFGRSHMLQGPERATGLGDRRFQKAVFSSMVSIGNGSSLQESILHGGWLVSFVREPSMLIGCCNPRAMLRIGTLDLKERRNKIQKLIVRLQGKES